MSKLPALTRAEIEALPQSVVYRTADGTELFYFKGQFNYLDDLCDSWIYAEQILTDHGGITARLVDPAPLREKLAEATSLLSELSGAGPGLERQAAEDAIWEWLAANAEPPEPNGGAFPDFELSAVCPVPPFPGIRGADDE